MLDPAALSVTPPTVMLFTEAVVVEQESALPTILTLSPLLNPKPLSVNTPGATPVIVTPEITLGEYELAPLTVNCVGTATKSPLPPGCTQTLYTPGTAPVSVTAKLAFSVDDPTVTLRVPPTVLATDAAGHAIVGSRINTTSDADKPPPCTCDATNPSSCIY